MALWKTYLQSYLIDEVTNVTGKDRKTRVVWSRSVTWDELLALRTDETAIPYTNRASSAACSRLYARPSAIKVASLPDRRSVLPRGMANVWA
jgi:hypothetical protein